MHRDRNNGTWPELKAKRHNKLDDSPLDSATLRHPYLDSETFDSQRIKKDRTAKQLSQVQNMFKDMADYDNEQKNQAEVKK